MRRVKRGEEGAALLGALIFVIVCSIVVAAVLSFADTDFRTTVAVREQRQETYAADAAVEAAIRHYQQNGKMCPTSVDPFTPPGTNDVAAGEVTVTCSGDGSGIPVGPGVPQYAIVTRGSASGDGIRAVSGALTPSRGGVFVEGAIDVTSGAKLYVVNGSVTAKGACSGTIEASGGLACNQTSATAPDPTGISSAPAVPAAALTARAVPACPGDGSPIVLQPGKYTDLDALKALMNTCSSNTFHLAPGTGGPGFFHFDFAGGGEWIVGNGETVVGGTLQSSAATVHTLAAGKKCDEAQQGVQLIFSGESRVRLASGGTMELCPPLFDDPTTQRVTIYGPTAPAGVPVTQTGLLPTGATPSGNATFGSPANAQADDGNAATASVPDKKSATLTLPFAVPVIPAGSTIDKVEVTVEHKESATPAAATLTAKVEGGSGANQESFSVASTTFTRSTSYVSDTFDLTTTFDSPQELTDFEVALTADNPDNGAPTYTQDIDVVTVSITYTPPGTGVFPPTSGCAAVGSTCPLVQTQGNAVFTSKGTVYAPLAMLNIQLVGPTYQVFGRGVIVRRLDTDFTASIACNMATIPDTEEYDQCFAFQLPRNRAGGDNAVFTATVRGRVLVRTLVNFSGATPDVRTWSSVNE